MLVLTMNTRKEVSNITKDKDYQLNLTFTEWEAVVKLVEKELQMYESLCTDSVISNRVDRAEDWAKKALLFTSIKSELFK